MNTLNTVTLKNKFGVPKFITNYERLKEMVEHYRGLSNDHKIVVVLGSFDMIHIGHARYIQKCGEHGDIVIVLIDPDEAVRLSKGPDRPLIPEDERLEMMAHLDHTDHVAFVEDWNRTTGLWERQLPFRPDVIVVSKREPADDEAFLNSVRQICGKLVILESQAETSTSNKIRDLSMGVVDKIEEELRTSMDRIREILGGKSGGSK
jgi:D-beta-D-heptose 7-phosphate kinase/D-beta-D-heptose 1-phosphate adenosyltransferase